MKNSNRNKRGTLRIFSLFLLAAMLFLTACPAIPPAGGTTGTTGSGTTGTTGGANPPAKPNPTYEHGERLDGMGDSLAEDAFVLLGRTVGESTVELTLSELTGRLRTSNFEAGVTYRVTDTGTFTLSGASNRTYDFKGAILSVPGGMLVKETESVTLKNLTLVSEGAGVTVEASEKLLLEAVELLAPSGIALSADAASVGLRAAGSRFVGDTAAWIASSTVTLTDCYLEGKTGGLVHTGDDLFVENCRLVADNGYAAELLSSDSRIWKSTVKTAATSPAAIYAKGGTNLLFALNCISGGPVSVGLKDTVNAVVLRNAAVSVAANGAHSTTVADNNLYGAGDFVDCNYLLANGNKTEGRFVTSSCENLSGDGVTDVDAREEYGVNYDLLPKKDKDLFVGMARKTHIREADEEAYRDVRAYIREEIAAGEKYIILAPGVYEMQGGLSFGKESADVTVCGYGVMLEKASYKSESTIAVSGSVNLNFKGLTLDHKQNETGQVVVVGKDAATRTVYAIAGAGMLPNWADREVYPFSNLNASTYGYRPGRAEPYADMGPNADSMTFDETTGILGMQYGASAFERIEIGDTLTCRGAGANVIALYEGATNIRFEDITVYGGAGFAFREDKTFGGTEIVRMYDTTGPAFLIDEETYFRYLELEERYDVDFGVYVDELGRYRGTPPKTSSVDATHSSGCEQGLTLISCLFESMCDDGTNQHGAHARLADVKENADGSLTLTYKNNLSAVGLGNGGKSGGICPDFRIGDRIYIYTSEGKLLCDTKVLTATKATGKKLVNEYGGNDYMYEVTVAQGTFDMSGLEGIDLASAVPTDRKICVDNMSRMSNGFYIDNTLVQNIRSRGFLIKGSDGVIKNCSVISVGMGGIAIRYELNWGESGASSNLQVLNNYIENSGHYGNTQTNTAISVCGIGKQVSDEYLLYQNILIQGNRIVDRNTDNAIYVNSARNVVIKDNFFGPRKGIASEEDSMPAVYIDCAKDVEISGNSFPAAAPTHSERVFARMNIHVFGADVEGVEDDTVLAGGADAFRLNLPIVKKEEVVMQGNWSVGFTPLTGTAGFTPFNSTAASGSWICYNGAIWGQQGGFWLNNGYGFAAQTNYNVAIRFTAPEAGSYTVRLDSFDAPRGDGAADGLFAIVKENTVIWPAGGNGSYANASNYYTVKPGMSFGEMNAALGEVTVELEAGESIYFVAKFMGKWANFTFLPIMIKND